MGTDYFDIESLLTDDEKAIRDTARDWVAKEFLPVIKEHHRAGTFPTDLIPQMGKLGFLGASLKYHGCAGIGSVAYGLLMQELERGDSGLRSFASVQGSLVMYPINRYGSEEQKAKWLPAMARGEAIGCFALTEADHGSDPSGMTTRAIPRDGGYLINGSKMWITNGSFADVALVWAKDENGEIGGYLVERGTPGYTAAAIHGKFSMRASPTAELSFQDCWIPKEAKLPGAKGLGAALSCLDQARYGIAWGVIGAASACYEHALEYAKTRIQSGKPIAARQLIQEKLVWMLTEITKAQLLALQLGRLKEQGKLRHEQVSMAKMNNARIALEVARLAREILGAAGIVDDHPIIRHMLNLETVDTYEGTHDIHLLIIGRAITDLDAIQG